MDFISAEKIQSLKNQGEGQKVKRNSLPSHVYSMPPEGKSIPTARLRFQMTITTSVS